MTNSAKQTKKARADKAAPSAGAEASAAVPAYARGDFWVGVLSKRPALVAGLFLLIAGWVFILHINRWHFTVPVFMLWMGWAGVIATVRFLWWAGIAMASDIGSDTQVTDVSAARRRELQEEKKVLLRAIKEIEFDRDLGKMSAEDATEIMRFYRARAIEVIKEIDGQSDEGLTVPERIERDLQVRLALETQRRPSSTDSPKQKAERIVSARANAKMAAEARAVAERSDQASKDSSKDSKDNPNQETAASPEDDETEAAESA